jgi:hypothetical protein
MPDIMFLSQLVAAVVFFVNFLMTAAPRAQPGRGQMNTGVLLCYNEGLFLSLHQR